MLTTREATEAQRRLAHASGADPYGVRTIAGARAAYLRGEIDVDEFERRVALFLSGNPVAVLQPGESILHRSAAPPAIKAPEPARTPHTGVTATSTAGRSPRTP